MAKNSLLATLDDKRIEIKYMIIALALAGALLLLASNNVFGGVEAQVNTIMSHLAGYGGVGMFLIALPSNATLVIQVPYNLPMFTLILYAHTLWQVAWIGTATGLGAGIGEVLSYGVARAVIANVDDVEDSALFRWTKTHIERHPALIPYLIYLASALPVPDLVMIVPVAMVNYPWRKMIVPMVMGKIFQNNVVAFIFFYAADRASGMVSGDINIDMTAGIVLLFVILIAYQIDKSRLAKKANNVEPGELEASNPLDVMLTLEQLADKPVEMSE